MTSPSSKLVPVEPTEAMIEAGDDLLPFARGTKTHAIAGGFTPEKVWAAMLAASPVGREDAWPADAQFAYGDLVTTPRKPFWHGRVCGWYRNADGRLGFNVEASAIPGAIHNYPQTGLVAAQGDPS